MEIPVDHPRRDAIGDPGFALDRSSPRGDPNPLIPVQTQLFGIGRMDLNQWLGIDFQQALGPAGHLPAVPVIEHPSGAQEIGIFTARHFSGREIFVGRKFPRPAGEFPHCKTGVPGSVPSFTGH